MCMLRNIDSVYHRYFVVIDQYTLSNVFTEYCGTGVGALVQSNLGALPFHPLHFPLFPLSLLFPSPAPPPAASGPLNPARGSGERCKLPQRGLAPSRNRIWCILALKSVIWWQQFLIIFLKFWPKIFLCSHYSGAPGARGPRFIEPPEPPVPTPL